MIIVTTNRPWVRGVFIQVNRMLATVPLVYKALPISWWTKK